MNVLLALVLFLEGALHVKVELALSLDALLLHVADDAGVHCLFLFVSGVLRSVREIYWKGAKKEGEGVWERRTAWSAFCWKWTNTITPAVKRDVAAREILDAEDMV